MAFPTAIADRLVLDLATLKSLLEIAVSTWDAKLTLALAAAKRAADDYCNNEFQDENGNDLPIPAPITIGVAVYAKRVLLLREPGLLSDTAGGRSKTWPDDPRKCEEVAHGYWWPYRMEQGY